MKFKVALAGNPNSGKTSLFNALTGANQHVGNWPGVTVLKKSGYIKNSEHEIELVDLPGIYSLSTYSIEEKVSKSFIIDENPDVIINIVDANNLERNLYLTLQLSELNRPVIIALNMMDEINKRGGGIDAAKLGEGLGIVVIPISAKNKTGIDELLAAVIKLARSKKATSHKIIKHDRFSGLEPGEREIKLAEERYKFISDVVERSCETKASGLTYSDKIDKIVTNRVLAIPIFAALMFLLFQLSFGRISIMLSDYIENLFEALRASAEIWLEGVGASGFVTGLICDGIISGISGIAPMLPPIILMFVFMAVLEDSGYMARAAFIMDKVFRWFGLSGKSFIPMLIGFGCSTPAIMAARTLENEGDRKLTIMLIPFMSCGAKLPVYALFAGVFFPGNEAAVIFSMYIMGIIIAILSGALLKGTLLKGERAAFIIELPPYRMPSFGDLCLHVWERVRGFVVKVCTVLVAVSIVIWVMSTYTFGLQLAINPADCMLAKIGGLFAPIFAPLGFGTWQATTSLIAGFAAKEAIVGTMAVLIGTGGESLQQALTYYFTKATALSFMVFSLLYVPCVAAFMTVRREMGTWKWTFLAAGYQMAVAWGVSCLVYFVCRSMGF